MPEPLAPLVIVIHDAFDAAVHAQPVPAVTETVPVDPAAAGLALVGLIEYVQPPLQELGMSVAATCDVPSLPLADAPNPWRAKTVQTVQTSAG